MADSTPTIGLALGGGGARGFAHIPFLEVFDEFDMRPSTLSGTSIGSIVGGLYASGCTGKEIRTLVKNHFFSKGESIADIFSKKNVFKTLEFFDLSWTRSGLLRGDKIMQFLYDQMQVDTFEDLPIPLKVVATDYWKGKQVVLESGPLLPAIKASMGLPGIFTPVVMEDRVLIDGGGVNPVPYDLLIDTCDLVIAIDVLGDRKPGKRNTPAMFEAVFATFDIMQSSIAREKYRVSAADLYLHPPLCDIDLLHFDRADEIYKQAQPAVDKLRDYLSNIST